MTENITIINHIFDGKSRTGYIVNGTSALGMILVLAMLGFGIAELLEARSEAWKQAVSASDNITFAVAQEIERKIETYDLSLKGAIAAAKLPGIDKASPEIRQAALFDASGAAKYLGTVLMLDREGAIRWSSVALPPGQFNFSDRDYFKALRDIPQDGLYISRPFLSRIRQGDPSIAVARRLSNADGSFDGIVQGALRLAYFQDMFDKLVLGPSGSIALIKTDGRLLARRPLEERYIGQDLSLKGRIESFTSEVHGHFVTKSVTDGVERFYTFQRVGALPLVVTNGISIDGVYTAWWEKAIRIGMILTLLSAVTCALCLLFRHEIARRMDAETALSDAADQLALMANTDSLTGLANRRAFDAALEIEWKRGRRTKLPVALIMFDADYFKLYNDLYGHPEGDRILKSMATCIRNKIRRPADFGARYGGEEFVVILPETDGDGATMIAESIRKSVEDLNIVHGASPLGKVTISAGVAWTVPNANNTQAELLRNCDLALYRSKYLHRNTVSIFQMASINKFPQKA